MCNSIKFSLLHCLMKPDPVFNEFISIFGHSEKTIENNFSHAHFAIAHQGLILLVYERDFKISLIIVIIKKML